MSNKVFENAEQQVRPYVDRLLEQYHSEIAQAQVQIGLIFVSDFDKDENPIPAIKLHGAFAAGCISLINGVNAVFNPNQCQIQIDKLYWDNASEEVRLALVDHELEHLELVKDKNGITVTDDRNRAKIKLKPDDFVLTGFMSVVRRHGPHAVEAQSVTNVYTQMHPVLLEFQTAAARLKETVIADATAQLEQETASPRRR